MGIKKCLCGCGYDRYSHGYAKYCQHKRTDSKKPQYPNFKVTQVKDFSKTPDFGFDNQIDLFNWLWDESKDKNGIVTCPYTGERLNRFYNTELWFSCFSHILPKGRYTYWKLNPDNLRVVFPEFHLYVDQKTIASRKDHPEWKWDKWDALVIAMKQEYQEFKRKNLLA